MVIIVWKVFWFIKNLKTLVMSSNQPLGGQFNLNPLNLFYLAHGDLHVRLYNGPLPNMQK
jgi:hypothetical protein